MITQTRIMEWYQHYQGNVCVSFSGGKDSTVLLHIARQLYPDIPAVFSDTGLEYSAIREFVKTWDNVDIVRPSMNFAQVITQYGYPLIGKEVAEAIYYARRIRPSGERERERMGNSPRSSQRVLGEADNLIETSGARNRRTILQGRWGEKSIGNDWKSGGAEEPLPADNVQENRDQRSKKSRGEQSWADWRRGCL